MKNINKRLRAILFVLLCVPFFGAWTAVEQPSETRYTGGELISTYASETISYKTKEVIEEITTANNMPSYMATGSLPNGCGAVAGANIIGFYDKYYPNLIDGWTSAYSNGRYKTKDATYIPALMQDLFTRMKTNQVESGVTENDFKTRLTGYVNSKGYNVTYSSLGSGNNFDYNAFKAAVKNNQVTALFVQPSNLYSFGFSATTNEDYLSSSAISGNHIMVAYGYYEVKYTLNNNSTRTENFLMVSSGLTSGLVLYKVGSYVNSACIVKIS